jgi:hypothetical protein
MPLLQRMPGHVLGAAATAYEPRTRAASAPGRQPPVRRRGRGASPGAGRGHRPPNPAAQGPSWPPRTTSSPAQLLTGPRGRTAANIAASGPSDRAAGRRQDSMATPGNFGGGSTGPDQIFLGITRAPPSAPGRGRAQSPVRQNPNPQATKHERQTRAARVEVSYQQSTIGHMPVSPSKQLPTRGSLLRIWFLDVVHRPAVLKGDPMDQN